MKKKNIINLIKYYTENNDIGFRNEAYQIAKDFDASGDYQLAEYILALLSNANAFVPQIEESNFDFLEKIETNNSPLPLPEAIQQDIIGVINAVEHKMGINKFLFYGAPGTGKTESAKQLSRILERDMYSVNFSSIIDSKMGQTQKNISTLFTELNNFVHPDKILILFDEIDAIALDRTNSNDLREMGRATSAILKGLDGLDERIVLIATTNLYKYFDKALLRRFDSILNFDRYTIEDLVEIGESILNGYLNKFKFAGRNMKLFRKIILLMDPILSPGELKNTIKTSLAFSNIGESLDYLRLLYKSLCKNIATDLKSFQKQGFSLREIEILTKVSKSQASRQLKE